MRFNREQLNLHVDIGDPNIPRSIRMRVASRAVVRSTKTFGIEGVGRALKLNGLTMGDPDVLPLLELFITTSM